MCDAVFRPGRIAVAHAVLAIGAVFVLIDLAVAGGIDPFETPPPAALGSGVAPSGGHCAAPP
jgi:hypothetical protein